MVVGFVFDLYWIAPDDSQSVVVVSQIASVDKARLGVRIGSLSATRVDQILDGLRFQQRSFFER